MSAHGKPEKAFRRFSQSEDGVVAIIFGLTLLPMLFIAGAGVDFTRYAEMRANLQQATDNAALRVASRMTPLTTTDQARAQAQVSLNAEPGMAGAQLTSATISGDNQQFCLTTTVRMGTAILNLAHIDTLTANVAACASPAGAGRNDTFEIALVLDNSGSMNQSAGGLTKLAALKSAAASFVDVMFAKAPDRVSFSITPFAGAVVAVDPTETANRSLEWIDRQGDNSQHWVAFGGKAAAAAGFGSRFDIFANLKQRNAAMDWRGCFETPVYPKNVEDIVVTPDDAETLLVPYLAPDEPSGYSNNNYLDDNGATTVNRVTSYACPEMASANWARLTHVCKYKPTAAKTGSYGPTSFFGPNAFCPDNATQLLMRLTGAKTEIGARINKLVANGNTNLHEGFMWGWRTLSPKGPFAEGRAYDAEGNRKIMVFMTDGFNNWGAQTNTVVGSDYEALGYYSYNGERNLRLPDGSAGDRIDYQAALAVSANSGSSYLSTSRLAQDELTLEACENAKHAGVEIFTIGFSISTDPIDAQGLDLLRSCATNSDHYYAVENASELNAAFSAIGVGLGRLRLSQ